MLNRTIIIAAMVIQFPVSSSATPSITCHCFTDRSYNAARPAASDPYLLATTQNSFIAALFSVDKKSIVLKKQGGVSGDDLWVAYWLAARTGTTGDSLLTARSRKSSWQDVIDAMRIPMHASDGLFVIELKNGASAERLSQIIVDELLVRNKLFNQHDLSRLRGERGTNQEMILTALIALKSRRAPLQLFREVKEGVKSWGALLNEVNIHPSAIQAEYAALLKPVRPVGE